MQRKTINRWLITAWFLIIGCTLTVAYGQRYGAPYRGTSTYRSSSASIRTNTAPAYEFQSTSSFNSVVGKSVYSTQISEPFAARAAGANPRKSGIGDPEDEVDLGIGEIANPAPIGEPLILLALALLYGCFRYYRIKKQTE